MRLFTRPVWVGHHHQLLTFPPAFQHKRSGTRGVLRQETARVVGGIGFQDRRVDDRRAVIGQRVEERGERLAEGEFHRMLIHRVHFQIFRERFGRSLINFQQTFKRQLDRFGGHRRAVRKFCIICQGERPLFLVVRRLPARRQIAFHLRGARLVFHQTLVRGVGHRPVVVIDSDRRIQRLRIGSFPNHQHIFWHRRQRERGAQGERSGNQGCKQRSFHGRAPELE